MYAYLFNIIEISIEIFYFFTFFSVIFSIRYITTRPHSATIFRTASFLGHFLSTRILNTICFIMLIILRRYLTIFESLVLN